MSVRKISIAFASPEDWTKFRDKITKLYAQHALSQVMAIMEEESGFKAT